jgi:hypothetical protein
MPAVGILCFFTQPQCGCHRGPIAFRMKRFCQLMIAISVLAATRWLKQHSQRNHPDVKTCFGNGVADSYMSKRRRGKWRNAETPSGKTASS